MYFPEHLDVFTRRSVDVFPRMSRDVVFRMNLDVIRQIDKISLEGSDVNVFALKFVNWKKQSICSMKGKSVSLM